MEARQEPRDDAGANVDAGAGAGTGTGTGTRSGVAAVAATAAAAARDAAAKVLLAVTGETMPTPSWDAVDNEKSRPAFGAECWRPLRG